MTLLVRQLGTVDYQTTLTDMQRFTLERTADTVDELWLVQHPPVFTQGQAGKPEHLLNPQNIPIVQTDRGGQVTYHGPGQLIFYCLLDTKRHALTPRQLVTTLENLIIELLAELGVQSYSKPEAPGVYVAGAKIASLGLRFRKGCSYHGISLNVDMDLEPFSRINPCGYAGLEVTDIRRLLGEVEIDAVAQRALTLFQQRLTSNEL